jgi:hypothetical protein
MVRQALAHLVDALCRHAEASPDAQATSHATEIAAAMPEEEIVRLARELDGYLASVGQKLTEESAYRSGLGAGYTWTSEHVRGYALDLLRSWETHNGLEGMWVRYVQRVRPALWPALLEEAQRVLPALEIDTTVQAVPRLAFERKHQLRPAQQSSPLANASAWKEMALLVAKRLAIALVTGIAAYWLAGLLIERFAVESAAAFNGFAVTMVANLALLVGGLLGYSVGRLLFRTPTGTALLTGTGGAESGTAQTTVIVKGWPQVAQRLRSVFADEVQRGTRSPLERCQAIAERLQRNEP